MNKEILRLAIPNILSNLSVPLLSTVDTALMGRQESAAYIGAVALGSLLFNFIYWSFSFLRMGTTGLTAQAFGKNDQSDVSNILGRALITALAGSILLLLVQVPLANMSFHLLDASSTVEGFAKEYFFVRIWAAPATLGLYAVMGWFFGMQNAVYPLILTILINVVNIVFNIYFVNHLGMKADGVALGTVIAQYTGLVAAIILFRYKYFRFVKYFKRKVIFELNALKKFLALNRDIFLRTFCLIFAFAFFDNESARQGDVILAVNAILLQFISWMSYGIDGFAHASESLIGKYLGAKNKSLLIKAIRFSFLWAMGFAVLYSMAYFIFGEHLLRVFTDQENIIEQASQFLFWVVLFPIVATPSYIWDGIYIGHTASVAMRNTMVIALTVYLVFYYAQLHFLDLGNNGLWLTLLVFMFARGAVQWAWYRIKRLDFVG
ncbi:MAG: MATE family efflux transporter [Bacteroidota bacterium]